MIFLVGLIFSCKKVNAVFGASGYKYGEEMRPKKKKKKMFFSKNPTISEGEGGKLGALGEVIQAKKKNLYAGLLHDSEGALWDSRC